MNSYFYIDGEKKEIPREINSLCDLYNWVENQFCNSNKIIDSINFRGDEIIEKVISKDPVTVLRDQFPSLSFLTKSSDEILLEILDSQVLLLTAIIKSIPNISVKIWEEESYLSSPDGLQYINDLNLLVKINSKIICFFEKTNTSLAPLCGLEFVLSKIIKEIRNSKKEDHRKVSVSIVSKLLPIMRVLKEESEIITQNIIYHCNS